MLAARQPQGRCALHMAAAAADLVIMADMVAVAVVVSCLREIAASLLVIMVGQQRRGYHCGYPALAQLLVE